MRIALSFVLLFAAAAPAARADDQAARWAGTWTVEDESGHGLQIHITLKASGGKIAGRVKSMLHDNAIEYAGFKSGGDLRLRFENIRRDLTDCILALQPGGDTLRGNCYHLHHGDDGWRRVTGVREK